MLNTNEITGDILVNKADNHVAYSEGWERVFGNKEERHEDRIFGKKLKEYKLSKPIILQNSSKCLNCNEEIESASIHDFVTCSCGNLSVDGGHSYLKRNYKSNYLDTSVESDNLTVIREYFKWASYGPNMDKEKHYIKLKDMTTEHIKNILKTQYQIHDTIIEELFKLELEYRKDNHA